jgi:cytochrome b6-f complex iron-sulfur subunit
MVPRMKQEAIPHRRTVVLAGVVVLAGGGTLAACGSGGSSATSSTTASTATGSTTAPSTGSDDNGGATGSSGSGSAAPIVKLADVPVGGAVAAQAPSGAVIVAQPVAGTVVAFSAICTHQACKVAPAGKTLNCPCHGSKYDALTGKVLNGPAKADLAPVTVKVSGQDVVAG